ncbi:hypothetical protein [Pseudomonas gingeri]|uniref:hypothetical protein n=1 Tax=Pseudomonas gingeri TaxID=117681 RepID=UPI0015A06234|nr:hypothetical protein [Pseudomonas gingeri]NWD07406.1 hypothetical protein [Pseudomonas gingeri]NWE31993.1 hypothetical protein [Pseudomonas gingeri]NWE55820.1 hypothetical protein [Pseudomonas gingeri]NWF01542.1 hypothetical protein [Pseudomonas gingeri]
MDMVSIQREHKILKTDKSQEASQPQLEPGPSAQEYTAQSCLAAAEASFLSIVDQAGITGGLSASLNDVVNSVLLIEKDEYSQPSATLRTLLDKTDSYLTHAFGLFKTENNLPDDFLSDDQYAGPKSYWADISQPLIGIANRARVLLADAAENSSRPLPDGRLYTANNVEVSWYSSARNNLLYSSREAFMDAVDAATTHGNYREHYLLFSDWISKNLGSIDKSPFKSEKDLLLRCLRFLERADVQTFSARLLKEMLPEYASQIGTRSDLRLTAYAMARWSYDDTLAPFHIDSELWSVDPENIEGAGNRRSDNVLTLPIPEGSEQVDMHFALGLQRIALDAHAGGLRQVESTLKALSEPDEESIFSILPQDPCASVLSQEKLRALANERWGRIHRITEALYPYAFYPYVATHHDTTGIRPTPLMALKHVSTIDDATLALSSLCRKADLHALLSDFTGIQIQSAEGAWDILRRLVHSLAAPAVAIADNGLSPIPAFIAPWVAAHPQTDLLELVFRSTLLTRQYIPASAWLPGAEQPRPAEIPFPETLLLLEDPDATFAANQQQLLDAIEETTSTPAFASRLLDKIGLSAAFIQALPAWNTFEHYQLLQGLPTFREWTAKMTQAPATATPGEQAYLLVEALLNIAWPAVNDLWQLGPELTSTAPDAEVQTWGQLKERLLAPIHERLMHKTVTDRQGHATFLAGLLLQRARPELFLRDSDGLTLNYQSDPAAITLRWAARLLNEINPRASMAFSVAEVVTMARDIARQSGIDIDSQDMHDAERVFPAKGPAQNPLSELSGLILGEQTAATARAWGYENAMEWLNLTKEAEERNQAHLLSVKHEQAPDLRSMASVQLWALGTDPDARFGDQDISTLDAFLCGMNMVRYDFFIAQRNALLEKFTADSTDYRKRYHPVIKSQLELLFQGLPLQKLHILNTGRWRILAPSSRNSLFYKAGTLAVVELEPLLGKPSQFLDILKSDNGLGASWIDIWSRSAMLLPKPASAGGRLVRSGIPAGVGLEAGEWHAGLNAARLCPSDPGSTARQIIDKLVQPIWDTPMVWEVDYSKEQNTLPPRNRGERFSLLSLIPFYDYFAKPAAERSNEDHLGLTLEIALTALPGAKGVGSAIKTLGTAVRAGLQTSLGQGLKSQVLSIGQHALTTAAGQTVRRTTLGGLWQTLNNVGRGVSAGLADRAFRQGLRKSGLQLTYAVGESIFSASPLPLYSPRTLVRAVNKLWHNVRSSAGQAMDVLNNARQAFKQQLDSAGSHIAGRFQQHNGCPPPVLRIPRATRLAFDKMLSIRTLGCIPLKDTRPVRSIPKLDFFLGSDTPEILVKRIPETNSVEVHAAYKKKTNSQSEAVFTQKFLVKSPDESWSIAVRDRDNNWAALTPRQLIHYHEKIESLLPSSALRNKFYLHMQGDTLQSPSWKKLHETALQEAQAPTISRLKRPAPESPDSPPATTRHFASVPHCPGLKSQEIPRSEWSEFMYKYMGRDKYAAIRGSGYGTALHMHLPVTRQSPLGDFTRTDYGIYVTDLAPGSLPHEKLSQSIFGKLHGRTQQKARASHYFELRTSELPEGWTLHKISGLGLSGDNIFLIKGPAENGLLPDLPLKGSKFKEPLKIVASHGKYPPPAQP